MTFAINDYFFDPQEKRDYTLVENGENVDVNEENKFDYIEKYCYFKMYGQVKE